MISTNKKRGSISQLKSNKPTLNNTHKVIYPQNN